MSDYDGPSTFNIALPGNNSIRCPVVVSPYTGEPDITETLQNVHQHLQHTLPPVDRQLAMQQAEHTLRLIVRDWAAQAMVNQKGQKVMPVYFDNGLADPDLDQSMKLVQWHKLHLWLRSHEEWAQHAELEALAGSVYALEFDGEDCFLSLTIYKDKKHLNNNDNNKALLLRLAGNKYKDRPPGFPKINSIIIITGESFSPEYHTAQSGRPSPDITLIDFAPNKPDAWL